MWSIRFKHNLGKDEISSSRFRISFPFPQAGHATSTQHAEMGCSGRMELFSQSCMHGVLKKACPFSFAFQSRSCALCIGWSLGAPRQRSACARVHASMRDLNKDRKHPCFFRAERICCHTQASSCAGATEALFSLSFRLMITYSSILCRVERAVPVNYLGSLPSARMIRCSSASFGLHASGRSTMGRARG
jgi:hypothetical protein